MTLITVFGGTGFLGKHVVASALAHHLPVRSVSRHGRPTDSLNIEHVAADIGDDRSVAAAISGSFAVVNAVSLYAEKSNLSFNAVHVEGAARVARIARQSRVQHLVHVSGIGADPHSSSAYIRSRGEGEGAVRSVFPAATIVRPAVMFGPGDAFITPLFKLVRALPIFPLFGRGNTRLQPAHVTDVANAIVAIVSQPETAWVYELAGSDVVTYKSLVAALARSIGKKPMLLPVPFGLWALAAAVGGAVGKSPVSMSQIELMAVDNVASSQYRGFRDLAIKPQGVLHATSVP